MAYSNASFVVLAATLALGGCAGATGPTCTSSPVQSYPAVLMVSPANGATNVRPAIGSITVETKGPRLFGTLSLTGPAGTIDLSAKQISSNSGEQQFVAGIPTLGTSTTYTIRYTLSYPGACQGPTVFKTFTAGTFTTD